MEHPARRDMQELTFINVWESASLVEANVMPRRLRRNAPQPDPSRLGAELEVLEPSELRSKIAEMTGAVAARFAAAPGRQGRKG